MSRFAETMWLAWESHIAHRRFADVFERGKEHHRLVRGADQVAITVEQQCRGRDAVHVPEGRNPTPLLRVDPVVYQNSADQNYIIIKALIKIKALAKPEIGKTPRSRL